MAPLPVHRYQARSVSSGTAFTVIFTTLACVVILSCFIWGFILPYFRRRNHQSTSDLSRRSRVSIYNPRLQTPFPRTVSEPESIFLPTIIPPRIVSPAANASQSLFTPLRDRNSSYLEQRIPRSYTLPRVRSRSEFVRSTLHERDFGDAKEYIIALPEPLRLRSKTHDSQLVASSTLGRLPDTCELSASLDKTLHPNKLFEQLKKNDPRDSSCSSTSMKIRQSTDNQPRNSTKSNLALNNETRLSKDQPETNNEMRSDDFTDNDFADNFLNSIEDDESESSHHNASIAAMHRLRTYRSLVGAPPPQPLSRAGTLTRPKTPVVVMRNMYDKGPEEGQLNKKTVSRNDTISTLFRNVADNSDRQSSRSSQTSPMKASPETFTASALSLLPTPLCLNRIRDRRSSSNPTKRDSRFKEQFENIDGVEPKPLGLDQVVQEEDEAVKERAATNTVVASRPRPPALEMSTSIRLVPQQRSPYPHCLTIANRTAPHSRSHNMSFQASSIYSRDTQGMSIAYTPVAPEFQNIRSHRSPLSPVFPSTVGGTTDSDKGTDISLIRKEKDSTADEANYKVENWKVDVNDVDNVNIEFDTSPSPSLKRALSSLGLDCNSTHELSKTEDILRNSTISTDLAPSEARLSIIASPVHISDYADTDTSKDKGEGIPGGVNWL